MNRRDFLKTIGLPILALSFVKVFETKKPEVRIEEWKAWDNGYYKVRIRYKAAPNKKELEFVDYVEIKPVEIDDGFTYPPILKSP